MKRILFRLSMPSRNSWNGKWTGDERNYTITKKVPDKKAVELDGKSWDYRWDDGWCAQIMARILAKGERPKKSDGFYGYEWMVRNICFYGNTRGKVTP